MEREKCDLEKIHFKIKVANLALFMLEEPHKKLVSTTLWTLIWIFFFFFFFFLDNDRNSYEIHFCKKKKSQSYSVLFCFWEFYKCVFTARSGSHM